MTQAPGTPTADADADAVASRAVAPQARAARPAPRGTRIGHVHLKVSDLERAIAFYSGVLGLDVMQRSPSGAAFLSVDGYHHHLGLNTWSSAGSTPPPPGHTGLFHTAFLYPDRAGLADAVARVLEAGYRLTGSADHGVSVAVYLDDPDGNGVELYYDRPAAQWPVDAEGRLAMVNQRIDIDALLASRPAV
ncbi:MAG: VOC family protein [Pseudomonadota bacterium]